MVHAGCYSGKHSIAFAGWDSSSGRWGEEEPCCQKKERPDTLILLRALGMNCMYVCRGDFLGGGESVWENVNVGNRSEGVFWCFVSVTYMSMNVYTQYLGFFI